MHRNVKYSRLARRVAAGVLLLTVAATGSARAAEPVIAQVGMPQLAAALAIEEAKRGRTSPALLPAIERLARAEFVAGALGDAMALQRRALTIAVANFGNLSGRAAAAMTALAGLYLDSGRYLDAEGLLIAADRVLRDRTGDPRARAAVWTGLARVAMARGDAGAAVELARPAVALVPRDGAAAALRVLGAALAAAQRADEAEPVLRQALALDRERRGGDAAQNAIETARSLAQLANFYLHTERAAEALPLIEEATAIDQERLAPGHPRIGDDLHDLAQVYEALKRPAAAIRMLTTALEVLEQGEARETPRVAYVESDLSRLLREAGDEDAAEAAFRDARRILNKAEAEEHKRERQV